LANLAKRLSSRLLLLLMLNVATLTKSLSVLVPLGARRKGTAEPSSLLSDLPSGLNLEFDICYEYNVQQ
jgi:hypothetical protein